MDSFDLDGKKAFDLCLKFITEHVASRASSTAQAKPGPLLVGISGVQGCGKTTLASSLATELNARCPWSVAITCSIDQFYLTHEQQRHHALAHPSNVLVQHRGQPSTHDIQLALAVLSELRSGQATEIPLYDKSAFDGQGDRLPREQWQKVNLPGMAPVGIVIIEGWCLGFRALSDGLLKAKWEAAVLQHATGSYRGRLAFCGYADVSFTNQALKAYDQLTDQIHVLIHLDAKDPMFCYRWRLEQEMTLRQVHQTGMTEDQITQFVDAYFPAYELYVDGLRSARVPSKGDQIRLVLDRQRNVERAVVK